MTSNSPMSIATSCRAVAKGSGNLNCAALFPSRALQAGFGMLEVMISLFISMILVSALFVSLQGLRTSAVLTNNVNYLQDAGRFVVYNLSHNLRLAGYWGINVLPTSITHDNTAALHHDCNVAGWATDINVPIEVLNDSEITSSILPGCISFSNYKTGTDILIIRYAGAPLDAPGQIKAGNVYLHLGMMQGKIFKADNAGNINSGADFTEPPATFVYPFETVVFYISKCSSQPCSSSSDGGTPIPSLYQVSFDGDKMTSTLVAEYVEDMQVRVGLDTDDDGIIDAMRRADQVVNWAQARSTEVGVLVRSPFADDNYLASADGSKDIYNNDKRGSYTIAGKTIVKNDHYRREAFTTTVFMRNDQAGNTL